jgi:uncharacterized membrane protein YoaK (UPF0700 family)
MDVRAKLQPSGVSFAILLTLVAGYVDAIAFLRFGGIYVANMSGNSVAVGIHAAQGAWLTVLQRLLPIGSYVIGLLCARILVNFAGSMRRMVMLLLLIEVGLLALFMETPARPAAILFAGLAMGVQSATITRFDGVSLYTAFVTGSLVKFAEAISEWLRGWTGHDAALRRDASLDSLWFLSVWVAYLGGAGLGTAALAVAGMKVIVWACLVLAALAAFDAAMPVHVGTRV